MDKFIENGECGTFDFAFIDADKQNNEKYIEQCYQLVKSGGIIAIDNTIWFGAVVDETDQSDDTVAIRNMNRRLKDDMRFHISFLNIGDGLTLLFKK